VLKRRSLLAALIILIAAAAYWGYERYRYRFVHANIDLLHLLPAADRTLFYADVDALRRAGYLKLFTTSKQAPDYAAFVRATGFDYTRDLDALAASSNGTQVWLAARGRFHWDKIRNYAAGTNSSHGSIEARQLQPDVLALAIGPDPNAIEQIHREANSLAPLSVAPLWLRPSHAALLNPSALPLPIRIFAISLQSADSVVLALEPSKSPAVAFLLAATADFRNHSMATTARDQLIRSTDLLKTELAREHQPPSPRDLTGLLVAGTFQAAGNRLRALWPVHRELLSALE
jgi:hypothetical protein